MLIVFVVVFQNCDGLRTLDVEESVQSLSSPSLLVPTQAPSSPSAPVVASSGCQTPLKHFQFFVHQDFYLGKRQDPLYQVKVPAVGRAFARWNGRVHNESTDTHGWAGVVLVGNHTLEYAGIGDDIYGGETRAAMPIGLGRLTPDNQNVTIVLADVYVDNPSYAQKDVVVRGLAGTSLDVWVEDPSCENQQIFMSQYYDFIWPTTMSRSAFLNLQLAQPRRSGTLTLVAASEGSTPAGGFPANPNTIRGFETATLAAHIQVAGSIYDQKILPMPVSQGQGHLAFSNEVKIEYSNLPTSLTAALDVGSNFGYIPINGPTVLVALFEDRASASEKAVPLSCQRFSSGLQCQLSNGKVLNSSMYSDQAGWSDPMYSSTIQMADVDGDRQLDICARESTGFVCSIWTGQDFSKRITGPPLANASGWWDASYFKTIRLVDVNGDGKADVCARASSGLLCWLSNGMAFPLMISGPALSDQAGYAVPRMYQSIRFVDKNRDGKTDICVDVSSERTCWLSMGSSFIQD